MSVRRISLCLTLLPILGLLGCDGPPSTVHVGLYGQQLPLNVVTAVSSASKVIWACGDNSDAFKPAIYAPDPGPKRQWCLYIDLDSNVAILAERYPGSSALTAFLVRDLKYVRTGDRLEGHGTALVLRYGRSPGTSKPEDTNGAQPTYSSIDFFLSESRMRNSPPPEAEPFMTAIQKALTE